MLARQPRTSYITTNVHHQLPETQEFETACLTVQSSVAQQLQITATDEVLSQAPSLFPRGSANRTTCLHVCQLHTMETQGPDRHLKSPHGQRVDHIPLLRTPAMKVDGMRVGGRGGATTISRELPPAKAHMVAQSYGSALIITKHINCRRRRSQSPRGEFQVYNSISQQHYKQDLTELHTIPYEDNDRQKRKTVAQLTVETQAW